jgi:ABC-type cobalamin/Fe3+-siderophores transport system ATPase subunit
MRLLELYLEDYRVLRKLPLRFGELTEDEDSTYTLSFLVGVNGSGKSTVLRALVDILRRLEQKGPIPTQFRLEYIVGTGNERRHLVVENQPDQDGKLSLSVVENDIPVAFAAYHLPNRVVIFTTGNEQEWEELATTSSQASEGQTIDLVERLRLQPVQLAIQELPGKPIPSPEEAQEASELEAVEIQRAERFLLVRAEHIPLLVLCGLLADFAAEERLLSDVLRETKIRFVRGFSLKFRMNKGTTSEKDREYVERLKEVATQAFRMGTDYLLLFDLMGQDHTEQDRISARNILQKATGEPGTVLESARGLHLFEQLARLACATRDAPPVLREVNIFLERFPERDLQTKEIRELSPMLLFDWLSDGERSFLGRMCLFSLLGDTEALILLDEPEVHFNDYWKRQIVSLIDKVLQGRASHALVTTHSSITLTDAPSDHIVVLDRNGIFTSDTFSPGIRTYAADPSDIIVSVFGAPQAAGEHSVNSVQAALKMRDQGRRRTELERLLKVVGPGYWRYRIRRELLAMGE